MRAVAILAVCGLQVYMRRRRRGICVARLRRMGRNGVVWLMWVALGGAGSPGVLAVVLRVVLSPEVRAASVEHSATPRPWRARAS